MRKSRLIHFQRSLAALSAVTAVMLSSCAPGTGSSRASVTIQLGSRSAGSSFSASASWTSSSSADVLGGESLTAEQHVKLWQGSELFRLDATRTLIVPSVHESNVLRHPLTATDSLSGSNINAFCYFVHLIPHDESAHVPHEDEGHFPHDVPASGQIFGPAPFGGEIPIETDANQRVFVQLLGFADPYPAGNCGGELRLERSSEPAVFDDSDASKIYARPKVFYRYTIASGEQHEHNIAQRAKMETSYFANYALGTNSDEINPQVPSSIFAAYSTNQAVERNVGTYVFYNSPSLFNLEEGDNTIELVPSQWNATAQDNSSEAFLTPPIWGAEEEVLFEDIAEEESYSQRGVGIAIKSNIVDRWRIGFNYQQDVDLSHSPSLIANIKSGWKKFPPTLVQDISLLDSRTIRIQCPPQVKKVELLSVSYSSNLDQTQYRSFEFDDCESASSYYGGISSLSHYKAVFSGIDLFPSFANMNENDPSGLQTGDFTIIIAVPWDYGFTGDTSEEPSIKDRDNRPYFKTHGVRMWKFFQKNP